MSFSAYFDKDLDSGDEIASNSGWSDFVAWVEKLPARGVGELLDLADISYSLEPALLEKQLKQQLASKGITDSVRGVCEALLAVLRTRPKDAIQIVVWDGCNPVVTDDSDLDIDDDDDSVLEDDESAQQANQALEAVSAAESAFEKGQLSKVKKLLLEVRTKVYGTWSALGEDGLLYEELKVAGGFELMSERWKQICDVWKRMNKLRAQLDQALEEKARGKVIRRPGRSNVKEPTKKRSPRK
jgi:hypothetical protein